MEKGTDSEWAAGTVWSRPVWRLFFSCNTFSCLLHYIYEHVYEKEFRRMKFQKTDFGKRNSRERTAIAEGPKGRWSMERLEELRLIKQAKQGDVDAYGRLYEMVYMDLYRFALFTLKNPHDAEDVVSDTVTDSFVGIGRLKTDEAFRSWIFKILANKCRRILKQYAERPPMKEYEEALTDREETTDVGGESVNREDLMDLARAFGELSEEDRLIVSLSFFGGYTSEEIARMLRRKPGTVRSRQSRALSKMRELLTGAYGL